MDNVWNFKELLINCKMDCCGAIWLTALILYKPILYQSHSWSLTVVSIALYVLYCISCGMYRNVVCHCSLFCQKKKNLIDSQAIVIKLICCEPQKVTPRVNSVSKLQKISVMGWIHFWLLSNREFLTFENQALLICLIRKYLKGIGRLIR